MTESGSSTRPRWRPRISLLSALVLMTITVLMLVVAQLWREIRPLREEVRRFRDEAGMLIVENPSKVYAREIQTKDELVWRWRIWIPENREFSLRVRGGKIPAVGFPDAASTQLRGPGEQTIEYRIRRDPRDDEWYGRLHYASGSFGKDHQPWVNWPSNSSTSNSVGHSTGAYVPDQRIELYRYRASQDGEHEDPAPGFMIWIEPAK